MASGNADYAPDITFPLTIQQGGTGLSTLTLGALLVGEGTNSVGLTTSPSVTNLSSHPTASTFGISISGNSTAPVSPALSLFDDTANLTRGQLALASQAANYFSNALAGDIILQANTGNLLLGTVGVEALAIGITQLVTLAHPLAVATGGSGSATPALVAGSNIAISGSWPDETIALVASPSVTNLTLAGQLLLTGNTVAAGPSISDSADGLLLVCGATQGVRINNQNNSTQLFQVENSGAASILGPLAITGVVNSYNGVGTPSPGLPSIVATLDRTSIIALIPLTAFVGGLSAGFYRLSWEIFATADLVLDTIYFTAFWTQNGANVSQSSPTLSVSASTKGALGGVICIFIDAASGMDYSTSTPGTAPASYDLHFRLEAL